MFMSKDFFVILTLYVNDILLARNNIEFLLAIKSWLGSNFEMRDMGKAAYIFGVQIYTDRSRKLLALSQESYIEKILNHFNMSRCKPMDTPIAKGQTLSLKMCPSTPTKESQMINTPYSSAIRSLMYAMMCTRPDICYAVRLVSRYQSNPVPKHWNVVKRILAYLRGIVHYCLCYQGGHMHLTSYIDAKWDGDLDKLKLTSGYAFLLS